ncbi:MAG: hypothetical protein IKP40_06400 [Clostridia bacterium]|nr:hypothetical protein [Clostridia bacterium]
MKKLVALLLAALMVVSSMAVLAEEPVKSPEGIEIEIDTEAIEIDDPEEYPEFDDWEPNEEIQELLEGKVILEQVVVLPGEWEEGDLEVTFTFPTPFNPEEEIVVVFAVGENQYVLEHVINEDTTVTVTFPEAVMEELVEEGAGLLTVYGTAAEEEEEAEETEEEETEETEEPEEPEVEDVVDEITEEVEETVGE